MSYFDKLKDPRWQKRRLQILERDEWHCCVCGDGESTLYVHHQFYKSGVEPWNYPSDSMVTLCGDCHGYHDTLRKELIEQVGVLSPEVRDLLFKIVLGLQCTRYPSQLAFLQAANNSLESGAYQ